MTNNELVEFCREIELGPDTKGNKCRHCHSECVTDAGCDPTPLCHECAHDFAALAGSFAAELNMCLCL